MRELVLLNFAWSMGVPLLLALLQSGQANRQPTWKAMREHRQAG